MRSSQAVDTVKELIWDPGAPDSAARSELKAALSQWKLLPYSNLTSAFDRVTASYVEKMSAQTHLVYSSTPVWLVGVKKLNWDSDFFGIGGIGRLEPLVSVSVAALSPDAIASGVEVINRSVDQARQMGLKQLSAPVHCSDSLTHRCLEQSGFRLMDSIVTYNLNDFSRLDSVVDPCLRKAELTDMSALSEISGECFANRLYNVNRFNSDPQFPSAKVREMYSLWLENSFKAGLADIVFTYVLDGNPVGFITATLPTKEDLSLGFKIGRIPLNAVHPNYHGKGVYTKLVKAAVNWLRSQNVEVIEIKTQLPNAGVHRTWSRLGAHNTCSSHTFHLNLT
ncbi:MAG: GNAT family N-acetyltransferase [Cyanobacteria bacterium SZAS-4]|nr:GNAT family N-acetyltransferase [Cyanobacteria bacterium SZAS-4]